METNHDTPNETDYYSPVGDAFRSSIEDTFDICVARHEAEQEAYAEWVGTLDADLVARLDADGDLHVHDVVDVNDTCNDYGEWTGYAGTFECYSTDDYGRIEYHAFDIHMSGPEAIECEFCGEEYDPQMW